MTKTIGSFDLASLKNLRDDVTQYFWFESNSSSAWGSGAHITLYPESQFTDSTSPNYMKGQNIIMNTDGFSIRNGGLPMMVLDNDSLDFNAVDTSLGTYTTMATFGLTGATIGQTSNAHSIIDANGQRFYAGDGTTQLANIGYGDGTNSSGLTSKAPYYTLGTRITTTSQYDPNSTYWEGDMCVYDDEVYVCIESIRTPEQWTITHWQMYIGNYSSARGFNVLASGFSSHAEGSGTKAIGSYSHAEGIGSIAYGSYSHAEGQQTGAYGNWSHAEGFVSYSNGDYSHAEGYNCYARGSYSHASGYNTKASSNAQTAIGRINDEDTNGTYAFIIGNGDSSARSNALTVDWDGNVKTHNGEYELVAVKSGTDNDWSYRIYADGRMEAEKDITTGSSWATVGSSGIAHNTTTITPPTGMTVTGGYANLKSVSQYIVNAQIQVGSTVNLEVHRLATSSTPFTCHVTLTGKYSSS